MSGCRSKVALAKRFDTVGLDVDEGRFGELKLGKDRTRGLDAERLGASALALTSGPTYGRTADDYIVTVPAPVDAAIDVADPIADAEEAHREYGVTITVPNGKRYDLVLGTVPHDHYRSMDAAAVAGLVADGGTVADIKGMWRGLDLGSVRRWTL